MTIFHFADLQQSVQNSVLNFQSVQLQYSCTAVQLAVQLAAASYGATPAQHEALDDGNRRGVEGVLREYTNRPFITTHETFSVHRPRSANARRRRRRRASASGTRFWLP
eukprot:COSAG05_NODE_139_length_16772_cov_35.582559_10_plen_109_part_00